ncbi:MAG: regulatory protein RecX [Methylococcales bacterium]|nr:MAG: regulatory protein RecX [Methylococcales bacterium]
MVKSQEEKKSHLKQIEQTCVRLLAMREHSQAELLNKLLAKGFEKNESLAVIEDLTLQGWQSDLRYAESYARYRIQKGYGPIYVTYELKRNGISGFSLDEIVQKTGGNWIALIEQVYIKKYGYDARLDHNEWARRSRFLMQRGFPSSMISTLFDHLNIKL